MRSSAPFVGKFGVTDGFAGLFELSISLRVCMRAVCVLA